jgi:hypothetical protein
MKYTKILFLLLALGMMAACSSDNDEPEAVQPVARVQIMTVFAPGQLGDQGYADRVMKGVNTLMKDDAGLDSVEVNFIASYDVETTCAMMADWVGRRASVLDGTPNSRRLLVLTEPYMVKWIADMKNQLTANDEVLLLKADANDVEAAAQTLGMTGRVHGLNISAASAVRHFEEARKAYYEAIGENEIETNMMRLYTDSVVNYRDSICETIMEMSPDIDYVPGFHIFDQGGVVYSTEFQETAFQTAYSLCGLMSWLAAISESRLFTIVDLGSANSGAEFFLMGSNEDMRVIMVMLDGESNTALHRFAIIRDFDRALDGWTQQWLRQPLGTMPLMELHGGWDGYCTDDIDPWAFVN